MKVSYFSVIKWILPLTVVFLSACAGFGDGETAVLPPTPTIATSTQASPTSIAIEVTPTQETTIAPVQMATNMPIPIPTIKSDSTPTSIEDTSSALLKGPLIAFRVQNGHNYLLLFDVETLTFREVRQEHLDIPFDLNWQDKGCHLFARGNVIDLHGNIIEKTNDPENGEAHFQVQLLSPDNKMGVGELFLGQQEDVELEYLTLEMLDRTDPDLQITLAPNGGAYAYAWSPDGNWLAFTDFDENAILQVYRATPDGQSVEQLTFHSEDPGVIQIIEWSPDGQHIAYAAQAFLSNQYGRGGWIGLISLSNLQTLAVKPDYFQYSRGLWWSEDSDRISFVGEAFSDAPYAIQGTQIHWADRDSGIILNSFYSGEAPGHSFGTILPVGNLDTVFFGARDGYYLLDATTNTYEKILDDIPTNGLIRDFVTSPFYFPGEENCPAEKP
jgi:WD40 repeat protein